MIEPTIKRLVSEGFEVLIGPHMEGLRGYYVHIYKIVEDCEHQVTLDWETSGHGFTMEEALENAKKLTKGDNYKQYLPGDF